ncbi:MAG: hypothetical protein MJ224_05400 [archaeon]|nr:hypothetical protein [archaeon]
MSGSGGRLNILKNLSSKLDKLFLGDMIESNNSKSKSNLKSKSISNSNHNYDYKSQYDYDYYDSPEDKYSKYIYPEGYDNQIIQNDTFIKDSGYVDKDYEDYNNYNNYSNSNNSNNPNYNPNYNPNNSNYNSNYNSNTYDYANYDGYDLYNEYDEYNSNRRKDESNGISDLFNLNNLKNKLLNFKDPSKKNFGIIAFCLIFLILGGSLFYFGFYQPFQNELNTEKTAKLNELNTLYKGPLAISEHVFYFENMIEDSNDIDEVKSIDILRTATDDWRKYHVIKINAFEDQYGRIMMSFDNESKKVIMPENDAKLFVRENDAKILSNIAFEKVDTVIIPVSITRLQATGGLISVGSIVDIYTLNLAVNSASSDESNLNESESSDKSMDVNEEPDVSGATVLAILRSKDSGVVDSSINRATNLIKGNKTYPTENSKSFSTDVEELLKSSVFNAYDNNALDSYLNSYGVKLSDYERLSNIGELDTEYLVLLEVPRSDVSFVINNMENLILTIPTEYAPNWAIDELSETYYKELNFDENYF